MPGRGQQSQGRIRAGQHEFLNEEPAKGGFLPGCRGLAAGTRIFPGDFDRDDWQVGEIGRHLRREVLDRVVGDRLGDEEAGIIDEQVDPSEMRSVSMPAMREGVLAEGEDLYDRP